MKSRQLFVHGYYAYMEQWKVAVKGPIFFKFLY